VRLLLLRGLLSAEGAWRAPTKTIEDQVKAVAELVFRVVAELEKCLIRKMGFDFYVNLHVGRE
jgi:hypothetical protein